jgi:hypothetical protein
MLREIAVIKKHAKLLFIGRAFCALSLCTLLWLINSTVLAQPTDSQVGNEVSVVVSSTGCTPSSATKPAGQITLKVINQTGEEELAVQFYGGKGELIREAYIKQGMTEWSETFDLPVGSYKFIAGRKPEWTLQLTVQ